MVPRKAFSTHTTGVGFGDATLMRPHVIGHAVLSFETLIANWTLKRLLIRVGQLMPVEMVDVAEGLAAHLTGVVLFDRLAGFLHCLRHRHSRGTSAAAWVGSGGRRSDCRQDARNGRNQRCPAVVTRNGRDKWYHCGRSFLWP